MTVTGASVPRLATGCQRQLACSSRMDGTVPRVAADPANVPAAGQPGGWRGLSYRRLHGSPVMYRSAYGAERLRSYADAIAADIAAGRTSWCMFDNTAASAALGDALALARSLERGATPP